MGELEDILYGLADKSEELEVEGVNVVDYWLARVNLGVSETFELLDIMAEDILDDPEFKTLTNKEQLRVLMMHGFILGLVYGMGKEESEF